jgi:undecaprenyl-diphosphatase
MNVALFNIINGLAGKNPLLDGVAIFIANYLPYIFAIYLIYLWFFRSGSRDTVLFAVYNALIGLGINFVITLFYFHPRPFMMHIGKLLIAHSPETSFPSDHTTLMFAVSLIFLTFTELRITGLVLFLLSLIGGLARVYAGVHFPFDIIGSFSAALFSTALSRWILKRYLISLSHFVIRCYEDLMKKLNPRVHKTH